MSIWTPAGEHEIPKEESAEESAEGSAHEGMPEMLDDPELTPEEQEAMSREFEETRQRIAETPVEQILTTHVIGLYELAVIHLKNEPPNLEKSKLAIDALAGLLKGVEENLGEYAEAMSNALNEIQMAYVQVSASQNQGNQNEAAE